MGGFLGVGNSSAKTDRGNQLAGVNANWDVFNRGLPLSDAQSTAGTATTNQGLQGIGDSMAYWKKILSGNQTAVGAAAAPVVNQANQQDDAARRQQAQLGTARGGGVNAANQQAETGRMTTANNAVINAQPAAATSLEKAGTDVASVGSQQLTKALQALGLSEGAASELVDSSIKSRPASEQANSEVRQQWSNMMTALGF